VDGAPVVLERNAPVLGPPLLGDVERGEHLEPGGDGPGLAGVEVAGEVEHAVEPVAHAEGALVWLDVDVARAELNGAVEQAVHLLDDGAVGEVGEREAVEGGHGGWDRGQRTANDTPFSPVWLDSAGF